MKSRMFLMVFFVAAFSPAQTTTTQTNCSIYGSTDSCTSTSTSDAERNREMNEAGQKIGQAAGNAIVAGVKAAKRAQDKKVVHQSCRECSQWSDGVAETLTRHSDIVDNPKNRVILLQYVQDNHLAPLNHKSWDTAYTKLKNDGKLQLLTR